MTKKSLFVIPASKLVPVKAGIQNLCDWIPGQARNDMGTGQMKEMVIFELIIQGI